MAKKPESTGTAEVKKPEPPAEAKHKFRVEAIFPVQHGTIALSTVVLVPTNKESFLGSNPVARIELSRLTDKEVGEYQVGGEVSVELAIIVP